MDITKNGELRFWWGGTLESVKGDTYDGDQNFSKGGFVKILVNGRDPPSARPKLGK